ncbi:MAG: hypothetical protein F6K50_35045 [Moorea sp. SIO3I7]|nr:hypothetical protein [Moorena sp. SIO3I7]
MPSNFSMYASCLLPLACSLFPIPYSLLPTPYSLLPTLPCFSKTLVN